MDLLDLVSGNNVEEIAHQLLGARIITHFDGEMTVGIIAETEAYKAPEDKGSHAYGGRRTKRTETLYGEPGTSYVYLCYGLHTLFNIVTGPRDTAHAVLIRAIEPVSGLDIMKSRRKLQTDHPKLTNGPGKLTQALGIGIENNATNLCDSSSPIKIELPEQFLEDDQIIASPRVGIAYARECALWPWRFRIKENKWTSLPNFVQYSQT